MLYIYYYSYGKTSADKIPPKAVVSTILMSLGNNASMAGTSEVDLQVVTIGQLKEIIEQINAGQEAFNNKLRSIGTKKVKLLAVKQFNRTQMKLKGYLTQMSL